jgi:hypothetical protein
MKNKFLFLSLLSILSLILVLNVNSVLAESNSCNPTIKLVSQDPNPATPSDYVKVIFEITELENCDGFSVRLNPEYPFSLDSNASAVQSIETNPYVSGYRSVWMIPYNVRVDSAAFEGDYKLKLQYHEGNNKIFDSYVGAGFNITIEDSRTKFDTVIQESSGSDVSIAIANVGKYTANSVVVRIPEQESFSVTGTDGQMVGNLESGDYTIVGFTISNKVGMPQQNMTRNRNEIPTNTQQKSSKLKFDIYYTDNIGERRVINMELPLNMGNSSIAGMGNFNARRTTSTSSLSSWYKWIIILVILIIAYVVYRKYPKQTKESIQKIFSKTKRLIKKEEKVNTNNKIPSWIKNAKEKEKSK